MAVVPEPASRGVADALVELDPHATSTKWPLDSTQAEREARVLKKVGGIAAPLLYGFRCTSPRIETPTMCMQFVPGRQTELSSATPAELERRNPNLVRGDIYSGDCELSQSYLWRPLPGYGSHRTPVARWRFTPPAGLRYTPNDVEVPLQNRQDFFVIEARRGDAVQQTWLDLTRVGLLTKESAGGILLYGADLGTGRALAGMRITVPSINVTDPV